MKHVAKYIDLSFCMVVLPAMIIMFPVERWYHNFQTYMISLGIWLYALYVINRCFTVPWLFRSRPWRIGSILLIVASLAICYIFSSITLYTPPPNRFDDGIVRLFPAVKQYQQAVWSLFMIVEGFSFAVGLLIEMGEQRARRREVEAQRNRAELNLYKAQIKPHFMFNTLNSLYGLFLTKNDNALPSLEKFIDMMRYVHSAAGREMVSLAEETDYIRELVDLQSLRLSATTVIMNVDISHPELTIPPMLLVTFVENCFKHGTSPMQKSDIEINVSEHSGQLIFTTSNRIFRDPATQNSNSGIENCRRRLALSYPGAHSLEIFQSDTIFKINLIINLHHDKLHSN